MQQPPTKETPSPAFPAKAARAASAVILVLWLSAGCLGYHLGSMPPPGVRSIHVPTFVNQCGEPQAELATTRAVIQEFQKDGNLWVTGPQQADAILRVTLVSYRLDPLRYDRNSGSATREYRVTLTAEFTLDSTKTGAKICSKRVSGETTFDLATDLSSARTAAFPHAAQDLARKLVESVVDYW
jgi:hypothetical protein